MSEHAYVQSIRVDSMLGIVRGHGFELTGLAPTVNILFGPNGSGKTTLGRAMLLALFDGSREVWRRLLHGSDAEAESEPELRRVQLAATIRLVSDGGAERTWRWDLAGGEVTSLIDGEKGRLSVGCADLAQRYRLGLVELLAESNEEFAREMIRQAAGGIDLDLIAAELEWHTKAPRPRLSELRLSEEAVRKEQGKQSVLTTDAVSLVTRKHRQAELEGLDQDMEWIEKALECLSHQAEASKIKEALESVPEFVHQLVGDEVARARDLDARMKAAEEDLVSARADLLRHESSPGQLDDDERACKDVPLDPRYTLADALQGAEKRFEDAEQALDRASQAHLSTARVLAAANVPEGEIPDRVDAAAVSDAQKIVALAHRLDGMNAVQERLRPLVAQLRPPGQLERLPDRDTLLKAANALVAWLHAPEPPAVASTRAPSWAWLAILVAAVTALTLAVVVHAAAIVGVLVAGLAAWLMMARAGQKPPEAIASAVAVATAHRAQFEAVAREAGLRGPSSWTAETVRECHHALLRLQAQRESYDASSTLAEATASLGKQVAAADRELQAQCRLFEQSHRIAVTVAGKPSESSWILWVVSEISAYRRASDDLRDANTRVESARNKVAESRTDLTEALYAVGLRRRLGMTVVSGEVAKRQLDGLAERRQNDAVRAGQIALCQGNLTSKIRDVECRAEDRDAFWRRLGLLPSDYDTLNRWLEDRVAAQNERQRLKLLGDVIARSQKGLAGHEHLLSRTEGELRDDLNSRPQLRVDLDDCRKQVDELTARINIASEGTGLTQAQAMARAAQERLHAREQAYLRSEVRSRVLHWARESLEQGVAPVIDRAQHLFARFTLGRLSFRVSSPIGAEAPKIQARGSDAEPWRPVQRLSSGERIQLLMAIRIAFLQESEERVLPLFLDEVLGSSDDDRADLIIDAVIDVIRSGRQVFYATAQSDEVEKWEMRLKEAGVPYRVIDMAEVRRMEARKRRPLPPPLPSQHRFPPPGGLGHREYGEALAVPGVNWFEVELGSLHVWHVIDDPVLLHEVLCSGVESLGQLDRLGPGAGDTAIGRAFRLSRTAACAYRTAGDEWRKGRGKPLTLDAVHNADGVSDVFRDRIWQRVEAAGCDAHVFMQQLREDRPPRWRDDSTELLEAWLRANGYLSDDERVALDEIAARAGIEIQRNGLDADGSEAILQRLREMLRAS